MKILICLLILVTHSIIAQTSFRIMSYNAENFFDTLDNPLKEDNEFLPSGNRHWTHKRYNHKLQQIAKVICAAGEWDTPALVGLCEIENDSVLIHLLHQTPLKHQHYRYCITQSSDRRGINVALLYQRDKFGYLGHEAKSISYTRKVHKQSRDLLHIWGKITPQDTLDIFICHFPSRYGGEKESEKDRLDASGTLIKACDSLCKIRTKANIIVMGDFNDTPENRSLKEIESSHILINLFADKKQFKLKGSHKYQGEWSQLDHILVSTNLLQVHNPIQYISKSAQIYSPPFLLINDKTWKGMRPFRTYYGFKYEGGYSDHLPLIADFTIKWTN
ncbi:endonuclease/exonuclease/phosphatase family protein [Parabacteroides bouchesdurhonensis]|uniref:endonuclease/exonuclease/phosphatase family protein n=1 Tax=Parabacteroides bouchesdurhonensis TaxID=1936995 RepID=UPI000E54F967|nr:endonuclease/exonuclease/phosphatase family protein [Parabacteroides bouchesdurhonensis]RHJ91069.1 endonuclease [Bacteroides sp. AM07-16]